MREIEREGEIGVDLRRETESIEGEKDIPLAPDIYQPNVDTHYVSKCYLSAI